MLIYVKRLNSFSGLQLNSGLEAMLIYVKRLSSFSGLQLNSG
jgi:hypothetical protein